MDMLATDIVEEIDYLYPEKDEINVLLIDDDVDDVFLFTRLISRSKQFEFDIKHCRNLEAAAALLRTHQFDVIYADYWLGFETSIAFIHDAAERHNAPVILITGLDTPDIRRCACRAGAAGFLAKDDLSIQAIEAVTLAVLQNKLAR